MMLFFLAISVKVLYAFTFRNKFSQFKHLLFVSFRANVYPVTEHS